MKYLITILASLVATVAAAQEGHLPEHYSPGFDVDDVGFVAGQYDMPIWVVAEPGFSNGTDTCALIASMDCQSAAVFSGDGYSSIACEEEVPTGSIFAATCRNDPT